MKLPNKPKHKYKFFYCTGCQDGNFEDSVCIIGVEDEGGDVAKPPACVYDPTDTDTVWKELKGPYTREKRYYIPDILDVFFSLKKKLKMFLKEE